MDAKLVAEAHALHDAVTRLQRVGLVVDRTTLSPAHRRAALQFRLFDAEPTERRGSQRSRIGFPYPNAR